MNDRAETLADAVRYFSDPRVCFEIMLSLKWPDGKPRCPKCNCDAVGVIRSRSLLQCKSKECRKQFSIKAGTIFENSPLALEKWFVAVWHAANAQANVNSSELARALDVTQKTAWFMLSRIKLALRTRTFRKLSKTKDGKRDRSVRSSPSTRKRRDTKVTSEFILRALLEGSGDAPMTTVPRTMRAPAPKATGKARGSRVVDNQPR